jgi:hypothetical protein
VLNPDARLSHYLSTVQQRDAGLASVWCLVVYALRSSRGLLRERSSRLAGCVAEVAECLVYNHLFEC